MQRWVGICSAVLLLTVSVSQAQESDLRLVNAAAEQDAETVMALLDRGIDPNAARPDGVTALLWAAHWDDLPLADALVAAGADVNAADDHGVTPLARAAENASVAMAELLLAAGADPNVGLSNGLTPLMTSAQTGNLQLVQILLAGGAAVNTTTTKQHSTALMWAVAEGHGDIVRALLDSGADANASTVPGFTPLMYAAQTGDIAIGQALLDAGADLDAPSADGTQALPYAIFRGQDQFALFLLDLGADPNSWMGGVSALHVAAGDPGVWLGDWYRRHGAGDAYAQFARKRLTPTSRLPLVQALLDRGADPNARVRSWAMIMNFLGYPRKGAFEPFSCGTGDLRGATPLWVAAFDMNGTGSQPLLLSVTPSSTSTSADILRALLAAGADQHLTTVDGTTPFMAAAGLGTATYTPREPRGVRAQSSEVAVRLLLEAGADINAVNEADFTALHGAAMRGMNEVIEYLVAQGADINARDFRGRTAYRLAEGSKQTFQFQTWPETATLLAQLGADTRLGIPGTVQERLRDAIVAESQDD